MHIFMAKHVCVFSYSILLLVEWNWETQSVRINIDFMYIHKEIILSIIVDYIYLFFDTDNGNIKIIFKGFQK